MTVLPDGRIVFADNFCYPGDCVGRIRAVDNGTLRDLAGGSEVLSIAANGPGPKTRLDFISAVRSDPAGNLYVGLYRGNLLQITPDDRVHWIAGIGETVPPDGNGGPALQATLPRPEHLAVDDADHLYVRTWGDFGEIRMIQLPAPFWQSPPVRITSGPGDGTISGPDVSFAFDLASEFGPAICILDGASRPCSSPISYRDLPQGQHSFTVRPEYAGNLPASRNWTVDATRPTAGVHLVGGRFTLASRVTFRLSGKDDLSGVASFDIGRRDSKLFDGTRGFRRPTALQAFTGRRFSLYVRPGGSTCVTVRSRDGAGNTSPWTRWVCVARAGRVTGYYGWTARRASWSATGQLLRQVMRGAWIYPGTAHMRGVAVVATTCPDCGRLTLRLNGHLVRTVSLHSTTTRRNVVVPLALLPQARKELIEIDASARLAHVDLEGFALLCGAYGCSPPWESTY
jgi:hypothetical protein